MDCLLLRSLFFRVFFLMFCFLFYSTLPVLSTVVDRPPGTAVGSFVRIYSIRSFVPYATAKGGETISGFRPSSRILKNFLAGRSCGYRVAFMGSFRIFAESNTSSLVTLRYYINKTNILIPF